MLVRRIPRLVVAMPPAYRLELLHRKVFAAAAKPCRSVSPLSRSVIFRTFIYSTENGSYVFHFLVFVN